MIATTINIVIILATQQREKPAFEFLNMQILMISL